MTILGGKISIFLVIDQIFSDFPFLFLEFPYPMLNVIFDPFLTGKAPFSLCSYFHAHPTTLYFSKYWGEKFMGRPHLKFLGDHPPSPPRSPPLEKRSEFAV